MGERGKDRKGKEGGNEGRIGGERVGGNLHGG